MKNNTQNQQSVDSGAQDQSIIKLEPAITDNASHAYAKVAIVLESSYRTIDFSKDPDTILYSIGNSGTSVVALLRNTKTQDGKIAIMARFVKGNTDDPMCLAKNMAFIVEAFKKGGGDMQGASFELSSGFATEYELEDKSYLLSLANRVAAMIEYCGGAVLAHSSKDPANLPNLQTSMWAYQGGGMHIMKMVNSSALYNPASAGILLTKADPQFDPGIIALVGKTLGKCDRFTEQIHQQREAAKIKQQAEMVNMETIGRTLSY